MRLDAIFPILVVAILMILSSPIVIPVFLVRLIIRRCK